MASLLNFELENPGSEGILLLYNSSNQVIAVNINDTGCQLANYADSLSELQTISISGTKIDIATRTPKSGYYHYTTVPVYLNPLATGFLVNQCTSVVLIPFKEGADFTYNEYNALLGNTEEIRRYTPVFEVDYKSSNSGSFRPSNLAAILSGSAEIAQVQESNYSSIGIRNSRYDGAKTTAADYGVSPATTGTPFDGAVYLTSSLNNYICSQSLSDRNIELLVFTGNDSSPVVNSTVFEFNGNQIVPLRNSKVWVRDTSEIILTNNDGIVSSILITCST